MADNKGLFTRDEEQILASKADEAIKFDNKVVEAFDGLAFKFIIAIVDDYGLGRLNEDYKSEVKEIIEQLSERDWFTVLSLTFDLGFKIIQANISKFKD